VASFLVAHEKTAITEGGYANSPDDRGGETYKGISRVYQPGWTGWTLVDAAQLKPGFPETLDDDSSLHALVMGFYRGLWGCMGLDALQRQSLADKVYDAAVNMGPNRAGMFLQEAMNLLNRREELWPDIPEDGHIGPRTIAVMRMLDDRADLVEVMFNGLRVTYYGRIMKEDPSQEIHATTWLRRSNDIA